MKEVIVIKRRRNWEWQVRDKNGELIIGGRERSRPAARYQGYRTLFMMLAVGSRPAEPRMVQPASRKPAPDLAHLRRPARPFTLD